MGLVLNISDDEEAFIDKNRWNIFPFGEAIGTLWNKYDEAKNEKMNNNEEIKIDYNNGQNDIVPIFGNKFLKGYTTILASKYGVGKSLLSIALGNSDEIKKPLFLLTEDYNQEQLKRYHQAINRNFEIITHEDWLEAQDRKRSSKIDDANMEAFIDIQNSDFKQFKIRKESILSKMGIQEHNDLVLETYKELIKEKIDLGCDIIIVDSLSGLIGNVNQVKRSFLEKLIFMTSKNKITLVLIHHLNKKGMLVGSQEISNVADSIYILGKIQDSNKKDVLIIKSEKSRFHFDSDDLYLERINSETGIQHNILSKAEIKSLGIQKHTGKSCKEIIKNILLAYDGFLIKFTELKHELDRIHQFAKGTIINKLTELSEEGLAQMFDGKTWDTIKIIKT